MIKNKIKIGTHRFSKETQDDESRLPETADYKLLKFLLQKVAPGAKIQNFNIDSGQVFFCKESKNSVKKFFEKHLTAEGREGVKKILEERKNTRALIYKILSEQFGGENMLANIKSPLKLRCQKMYTKESLEKLIENMEKYESENKDRINEISRTIRRNDLFG